MYISAVVRENSRHCKPGPSCAIAYFYFDFQNKDARPPAVLRSLIKQFSLQCSTTPDALENLFTEHADGQCSPTLEELTSTAKSIIHSFVDVYIIFDALDESPDPHELLTLLRLIHDWGLDALHLLVTSRKDRDIEKTLSRLVSHSVSMDESFVDLDIRLHVSRTLKQDSKFQLFSAKETKRIETVLIGRAHGM